MRGRARVTVLGSGTSHGVPMIGCQCATCASTDPHDHRWRPSVLIALPNDANILVDTTPDLRAQALRFGVTRVDAILFTHSHADHIMGLDEVRRYNALQRAPVPCYADRHTAQAVRRTFAYIFNPPLQAGGGIPKIELFSLAGEFSLCGTPVIPIPLMHGKQPIFGYRLGGFAYLTDCSAIPETSWSLLGDVELLIIDALRNRPHPTHFTVAQAVEAIAKMRPRRALLTHICHDLPHAATSARLPAGVELAYDGLTADFSV